jgi:hypothetical protein
MPDHTFADRLGVAISPRRRFAFSLQWFTTLVERYRRDLSHPARCDKVRIPYFPKSGEVMLAKVTAKNQLTLPKSITNAVGPAEYFDVEAKDGQIVLTPVRIQRADAVRAKLAELNLTEEDVTTAVAWARTAARKNRK